MRFKDIAGHEDVKKRLRDMIDNNQLPHALLLHGPEGTGKLMLARAAVAYLHCSSRTPDGDSCGRCPSCLQHASHNHVDIHYSFPTTKKGDNPGQSAEFFTQWKEFLDEVPYADMSAWLERLGKPNGQPVIYRGEAEALSRNLGLTPRSTSHKVAVVWLPERFQAEAANKLLKLVEEPHADTRIFFVSNDAGSILPTIFSRLQRIEVKKLDAPTAAGVLRDMFRKISDEDALDAAVVADGNINEAVNILSRGQNSLFLESFMALMRLAYQRKVADLKKWSENMSTTGREAQMRFLEFCCRMMRENFLTNTGIKGLTQMTKNEREFSSKFSRFINSKNVLRLIDEFERARTDISCNGNAKIVFFDLAIHIILLIKDK